MVDTSRPYNLGSHFDSIANSYGDRIALYCDDEDPITFSDLARLSSQIARYFLSRNIRHRDVVAIAGIKTRLSYSIILACLRIGVTYVVLDEQSPSERLLKILNTCSPKLLMADDCIEASVQESTNLNKFPFEKIDNKFIEKLQEFDIGLLPETADVTGSDPAYIMFTSGSTGFPKGAVISHASVLNFIQWGRSEFQVTEDDIFTGANALYFDNSVFDLYVSIFNGASLAAFSRQTTRDPGMLIKKVEKIGCTIWFSVPSLLIFLSTLRLLSATKFSSIRCFIFGGEGYPKAKLKKLFDTFSNRSRIVNVYGPTECTCICSAYTITEQDFVSLTELPPLGKIADNFTYGIFNDGKAVPPGEKGELYLGGPNVGKGYYKNPDQTAEAFIQNPLISEYIDISYRTGDIVFESKEDGLIYFVGRKDNQIKHMGYRIELLEIELALNCLDYVTEAAVVHDNSGAFSQLGAVISLNKAVTSENITQDLKKYIPDYMIPGVIKIEDILPKNKNGKLNRKAIKLIIFGGGTDDE